MYHVSIFTFCIIFRWNRDFTWKNAWWYKHMTIMLAPAQSRKHSWLKCQMTSGLPQGLNLTQDKSNLRVAQKMPPKITQRFFISRFLSEMDTFNTSTYSHYTKFTITRVQGLVKPGPKSLLESFLVWNMNKAHFKTNNQTLQFQFKSIQEVKLRHTSWGQEQEAFFDFD